MTPKEIANEVLNSLKGHTYQWQPAMMNGMLHSLQRRDIFVTSNGTIYYFAGEKYYTIIKPGFFQRRAIAAEFDRIHYRRALHSLVHTQPEQP